MKISDVLRSKGHGVVTIAPDETVSGLLALLYENRIGACVVSTDGKTIEGIVSERDVVRSLHAEGTAVLLGPVSRIMTSDVTTGRADDEVSSLAATMTNERVRHVPIVDEDGVLTAIVSIGDVVKSRLNELQSERDQLRDYITH
ncbi:histidine kinase [Intrasporangium chromatireducens Q5-1]|uniref:Histidine kinase n=1 Tax=Intrasporangium chromatireducens Q5-1 TaxID=584657 RepID=W9GH93_9MICO|nr:CBS domain-containing protein [Intrasporangium chromatireducens]EWT05591.1 histidine kinase [Intrasporangium chromatireducens Q5-1]